MGLNPKPIFGVIVGALLFYTLVLLLSSIYVLSICSQCHIQALWIGFWAYGILSVLMVGHFSWQELRGTPITSTSGGLEKPLVRIMYVLSVAIAIVWLILLLLYAIFFANTGTPVSGSTTVIGITSEVEIVLDENDVLHVSGLNLPDVFYGQGYAHAQQRLFQMEIQRRFGQGRLSQVLGESAIDLDKFSLTVGFYRAAKLAIPGLSPQSISALNAYCAGVNAFIAGKYKKTVEFNLLPIKAEPNWKIEDLLVYAKLVSYQLSGNWNNEISRLIDRKERNISPTRLQNLEPADLEVPTVVSDLALGDRYAGFPNSTHRSVSLKYEIERLDQFLNMTVKRRSKREAQNDVSQNPIEEATGSFMDDIKSLFQLPKPKKPKGKNVYERASSMFPNFFSRRNSMRASNNWVVHGNKTSTGRPILCNDPHLELTIPSVWTLVHLKAGNDLNVIGASFPGLPGIMTGYNEYISWGVTNSGADVQDLYIIEEISSGNASHPGSYIHNSTTLQYTVRNEIIQVHGRKTPISLQVLETVYGPVINHLYEDLNLGAPISLKWVSLEPNDTTFDAFYGILQAKDFDDFRTALSSYVAPAQNFVYADKTGNIGYQLPGKIPIRVDGHTGAYPVPGNGSFDWIDFIEYWNASLWVLNPPEGFIASANNRVASSKYPFNILNDRDWEPEYRAKRITNELSTPYPITVDQMKTLQQDQLNLFAVEYLKYAKSITGTTERASEWITELQVWNGLELSSSRQAYVWNSFWVELMALLTSELGQDDFSNPRYYLNMIKNLTYPDPACKNERYDCGLTIGKALNRAMSNHGIYNVAMKKTWGSIHSTLLYNPIFGDTSIGCLWNKKLPGGGGPFTVNIADYNVKNFNTEVGASYRQVVDMSDLQNSGFILPGGQTAALNSPKFVLWFRDWAAGEYLPMITSGYKSAKVWKLRPKH